MYKTLKVTNVQESQSTYRLRINGTIPLQGSYECLKKLKMK